jgi:hypothetical protein
MTHYCGLADAELQLITDHARREFLAIHPQSWPTHSSA